MMMPSGPATNRIIREATAIPFPSSNACPGPVSATRQSRANRSALVSGGAFENWYFRDSSPSSLLMISHISSPGSPSTTGYARIHEGIRPELLSFGISNEDVAPFRSFQLVLEIPHLDRIRFTFKHPLFRWNASVISFSRWYPVSGLSNQTIVLTGISAI